MADIAIGFGVDGGDVLIRDGDLVIDTTIVTPALLSIFCDQRADVGSLPVGEYDQRGWFGDAFVDPYGSLLWLLDRERASEVNRANAEVYVTSSLLWMEEDGHVDSFDVTATLEHDQMRINIVPNNPQNLAPLQDRTGIAKRVLTNNSPVIVESSTGLILEIEG